jgi:hypothetical protein
MSNINSTPALTLLIPILTWRTTTKQKIQYTLYSGPIESQPLCSYMVNTVPDREVFTFTADGLETKNTAQVGDMIMSGVTGEQYVVRRDKFVKLYDLFDGTTVIPNQAPRLVAEVSTNLLPYPIEFTASWGELMVLKPGDFLVLDGDNVYRIARTEFLESYDWH